MTNDVAGGTRGSQAAAGEAGAGPTPAGGLGGIAAPDDRLAALVASRLCHDLVNPIGAIANGLDLVAELGPAEAGDEMRMIRDSAGRAGALLAGLRLAFGRVEAEGAPLARSQLVAKLRPIVTSRRVAADWEGLEGGALPPPVARLAALMAMAGRGLLGLEGRLRVVLGDETGLPVLVEAEGARAAWTPALRALADRPDGTADATAEPRTVEFAMLAGAARQAGARLELVEAPGRAGLRATARD